MVDPFMMAYIMADSDKQRQKKKAKEKAEKEERKREKEELLRRLREKRRAEEAFMGREDAILCTTIIDVPVNTVIWIQLCTILIDIFFKAIRVVFSRLIHTADTARRFLAILILGTCITNAAMRLLSAIWVRITFYPPMNLSAPKFQRNLKFNDIQEGIST
ncbi:hypothetical protein AC578_1873 [Pseudocercospora eumusae]|uniref:Uncharacterized protein n=1 Tax=Pseudocercospora eumusae TaxID=321146 RepID=A0A139GYJ1_9PEZI|nr:hypothetical protein AC578_1873 [Pseudocercospora eumusae]